MADAPSHPGLPDALAEAFEHLGQLRFDQFMELALYAPASGFFATGGGAGRRGGDFVTSAEVGPLFGAVVARYLDEVWEQLGHPERLTVVEAGAGRGALAIAVRNAEPRCAPSLLWVLVERSPALRERQHDHLDLVDVDASGVPAIGFDGTGPWFHSVQDMPSEPFVGVVLANELLDNLPLRVFERSRGSWSEVVVRRASDGEGRLVEALVSAEPAIAADLDRLAHGATEGARVPVQHAAARWVQHACNLVDRGHVIVFDYVASTAEIASRHFGDWLRTYRAHERGGPPLSEPGRQDLTADVALDQLPPPTGIVTQAHWLERFGIAELVATARTRWEGRAGVGDLDAIRARSTLSEAAALTDPAGLGGFTVITW
ncbi:MAG: SAM-dependent methyltransferase [Microthrixaceae bacterium]